MKWRDVWVLGWIAMSIALSAVSMTAQAILVPAGSIWRYLDTGESLGPDWRQLSFDDQAWLSGPAQLGFSSNPPENDESTLISRTNALGETNITFYFRHTFNVPNSDLYSNLMVRLQRDDGAIVYLNGIEVFRSNLLPGPVNASTLALLAQDDGMSIYAGPVNPTLLFSGNNVLAVEVHQNALTSTDISFDLALLGNVTFANPTVTIASPASGAVVGSPTVLLVSAPEDSDGEIASVEFLDGAEVLGTVTNAPFTFTSLNTSLGQHTYTAVAVDSTGLSATSAPAVITVVQALVPSRAEWNYLDDGSEPDAAWFTAGFNDSGWSNGVAQFGFGEGDETTVIRHSSDLTGTNIITYYFRHAFDVADPASITNLTVRLLRDDGGIVYLNGTEVFRNNMPAGPVNSSTFAPLVAEDKILRATRVNPALLAPGRNIIAVEIHQANLISSDVSFDLELLPNLPANPPSVAITSPADHAPLIGPVDVITVVTTTDVDDAIASVAFYLDGRLTGTVSAEPYTFEFENLLGRHRLVAVATDSGGLSSTSAPVNLGIAGTVSLISSEATWKYLDNGVDQGTSWRLASFDDSAWPAGPGRFGTNDPGISTIVKIRKPNGLPLLTTYYRHSFTVTNLATITELIFGVLRDDGCVAYLNGAELFRMNMPSGSVTFNTQAPSSVAGADESTYYPTNLPTAQLLQGVNVLAVELHQAANTSDAGFDLSLVGVTPPPVTCPPLTIDHVGDAVRISWSGDGFILQESEHPDGPYSDRPGYANPYVIVDPAGSRFFRLTRR